MDATVKFVLANVLPPIHWTCHYGIICFVLITAVIVWEVDMISLNAAFGMLSDLDFPANLLQKSISLTLLHLLITCLS